MIRAISAASGEDSATALAKIGARTSRHARPKENKEDMRTRERLSTLHPDESTVGAKKD
jgi:hypothetical protein